MTATKTIVIQVGNTPPTATISSPADGSHYNIGDTITFSGSGTDTQDGTEPPANLAWAVVMWHCLNADFTNCHTHPTTSMTGTGGSFPVTDHGDFTYFVISLTVTDSGGLTNTKQVTITPNRVNISFDSNQPGIVIAIDSGTGTVPFTHSVPKHSQHVIFASSPQTSGGNSVIYDSWSDGGAQQHSFIADADASVHRHVRRRAHADADGHEDGYGNAHADGDEHPDRIRYGHQHADGYGHAHVHAHARHTHRYADRDGHAYHHDHAGADQTRQP